MARILRSGAVLLCFPLVGIFLLAAAGRPLGALAVPEEFELFLTMPGVALYGNESEEEAQEYVQILDLSAGARLEFWYGALTANARSSGLFGGSSPTFERHYLPDVWLSLAPAQPGMLCLANGQFFRDTVNGMWVNPTELAFPLKHDGVVISEGYERRRFRSHRVMLALWQDHADITALSRQAFYSSTAPDIIAGLHEHARVRPTEELGRTVVGVGDGDGDGKHERLFIYSGAAATQGHAAGVLRAFGAQKIMYLDGGGSAQLSCEGASYIRRVRPLPQMMATIAAAPAAATDQQVERSDPYLQFFEQMLARWLQRLQPAQ